MVYVLVGIAFLIAALMFVAFLGMFSSLDDVKRDEELERKYSEFEEWYSGQKQGEEGEG